jgi:protoheme IX farnesyltransferase
LLFAIIFFWTPPHFWALAIRYEEDYTAADVPMLPSVVSRHETAVRILVYTLIVWALTIAFIPVGQMGWIYGVLAVGLGGFSPICPCNYCAIRPLHERCGSSRSRSPG